MRKCSTLVIVRFEKRKAKHRGFEREKSRFNRTLVSKRKIGTKPKMFLNLIPVLWMMMKIKFKGELLANEIVMMDDGEDQCFKFERGLFNLVDDEDPILFYFFYFLSKSMIHVLQALSEAGRLGNETACKLLDRFTAWALTPCNRGHVIFFFRARQNVEEIRRIFRT